MNLEQSMQMSKLHLKEHKVSPKTKTSVQVAQRVFDLCASAGFPYTKLTPEGWANKFLASKKFTLMEIDINAAASINVLRSEERVGHYMQCSSESLDPIVVDYNKRHKGKTASGFFPEVVVQDGTHRKLSRLRLGHTKILAWVGDRVIDRIKAAKVVDVPKGVKFERQVNRSNWNDKVSVLQNKIQACGARSSGSLEDTDASDTKIPPDASDASQSVDASDRLQWNGNKPQVYAPGTGPGYTDRFVLNTTSTGVGLIVPNPGASNSDTARALKIKAGGPGSGRHPGTGMTDQEFTSFAGKVGQLRNQNRAQEDAHRAAGRTEEANKIYTTNKEAVRQHLTSNNVKPKAFDDHMKQLSKTAGGPRVNVKMQNMFPDMKSKGKKIDKMWQKKLDAKSLKAKMKKKLYSSR